MQGIVEQYVRDSSTVVHGAPAWAVAKPLEAGEAGVRMTGGGLAGVVGAAVAAGGVALGVAPVAGVGLAIMGGGWKLGESGREQVLAGAREHLATP